MSRWLARFAALCVTLLLGLTSTVAAQRRAPVRVAGVTARQLRAIKTALTDSRRRWPVEILGATRVAGAADAIVWVLYSDFTRDGRSFAVARARLAARNVVSIEARSAPIGVDFDEIEWVNELAVRDVDGDAAAEVIVDLVLATTLPNEDIGDAAAHSRRIAVLADSTLAAEAEIELATWSEYPSDQCEYGRAVFEDATGDGARDLVVERWSPPPNDTSTTTNDGWAAPPTTRAGRVPTVERIVHPYVAGADRFAPPTR